ncbi:hypothetical protein MFUL124B02_13030 [Myxococcus fulvus 124B02]|nr:hypothetical protein MFUL124B02_13030 [Myxococcus fulvus 124B02]
MEQIQLDLLYHRLDIRRLDIHVTSKDQNGYGDLINCLHTGRLLSQGTGWNVVVGSTHQALERMLPSFPWVTSETSASWEPHIRLETPTPSGDEAALAVSEYSYRVGGAMNAFTRKSGLGPDEIGIMINQELGIPLSLAALRLETPGLGAFFGANQGSRFFFGYGAGQKKDARYNLLLDRVVFDAGIERAVVFPVNHNVIDKSRGKGRSGKSYIDEYLKDRHFQCTRVGKDEDFGVFTVATVAVGAKRTIKVVAMKPGKTIVYADMQQMWRAADRSFTIAEGDQSFSEAISAGIPMAYHLWPADDGLVHKRELFQHFVARSEVHAGVDEFLRACASYPEATYDKNALMGIIACSNDEGFVRRYAGFAREVAERCNIETGLQCFVRRHWLRKFRSKLDEVDPELRAQVEEIVQLEERGDFHQAVAATRAMLSASSWRLLESNIKWGVGEGAAMRRLGVVKEVLSPRPAGAAQRPVGALGFTPEILSLISEYEESRVPVAPPVPGLMGAAGAPPAETATAAAGTAPVGASAAAAAGVVPAPPKPPSS